MTRALVIGIACVACVACAASLATRLHAQRAPDLAPYLIADRAAEIALARTAAPRAISDSATVLVLTRTGYVEGARGTNGVTCLVARSFFSADADDPQFMKDPGFWQPNVSAPHCFNPPAARTVLPPLLDAVRWLLSGVSPAEATARTKRGYATRRYAMPATGAMTYMLSPQQRIISGPTHWLPHLMFYFARSIPTSTWGIGIAGAPTIDASASDPTYPVTTLLVPVRTWSDGTSAMPTASH